jgi:hypothetical protein
MRPIPFAIASVSALAALPLIACLQQVSTGTGTTDPGGGGAASTATSGTDTPAGAGCATDPATGVTLCEQTSLCPALSVDQGTFPSCGFRIHTGTVIDLECLCGDVLCPIGIADTCDQASQLLSSQTSSLTVCQQASDGRCVQVTGDGGASPTPTAAPTSTTSPAPSTSTCDKVCEAECAGEPNCIQLCGC